MSAQAVCLNPSLSRFTALLFFAVVCFASAGCGGGFDADQAVQDATATSAQRLSTVYVLYQQKHGGKGPRNEKAFRKFIPTLNPVILERTGIDADAVDDLFVSDRDGQPLKVKFGVVGNSRTPPKPVVFEEEGADGKRIVAFTGNKSEEVEDDSRYDELWNSK
jgi:hypothetical protein